MTSTVFASGWRWIASTMDRLPWVQLAVWLFSTESITLATSRRRTGLLLRVAMMRPANWSASLSWVSAWMVRVWFGFLITPTGVMVLARSTASCSSSMPMSREASALGSTWMRTAYFWLPKMLTWATPDKVDSRGDMTCWAKSSSCDNAITSLRKDTSRIG